MSLLVDRPEDLGPAQLLRVAEGEDLSLSPDLLSRVATSREATLAALATSGPVYGVTTGMGSQSGLAVDAAEQHAFQDDLMLARSVGTAPWLDRRTARAAVAVRLRTLLEPEAGVSPDLISALAGLLRSAVQPAVPETANGAAGEIIPLAHLGALLTGRGEGFSPTRGLVAASELLHEVGLAPYEFGAKEGVAFLQGVPTATARAVLLAADARLLAAQQLVVGAAEIALVRAPRDPYHPALARGDDELGAVLRAVRDLAGEEDAPRLLQAPVSFRVLGPALAHLHRCVHDLEEAADRALTVVSTSPALVEGRFLGTAGFDGFELSARADALRVAILHVAETAAARLHRMLDPRVTGLAPQLSHAPGRHAGLVVLHKRAVGLLHEERRTSAPASLGATETSQGQEDVQSFALEALSAATRAADVARDVTACELVTLHQATLLDPSRLRGSAALRTVLRKASEHLLSSTHDRTLGPDVSSLEQLLMLGWARNVLDLDR